MAAAVVMCILGTVATFFVVIYIGVQFDGIASLKDDKARLTNEIASLRSTVTQQRKEIDDQKVRDERALRKRPDSAV